MTDLVENTLKQLEEQTKNKTKKEQNEASFNYLSDVLEVKILELFMFIQNQLVLIKLNY
jgi:hypothetical protein